MNARHERYENGLLNIGCIHNLGAFLRPDGPVTNVSIEHNENKRREYHQG